MSATDHTTATCWLPAERLSADQLPAALRARLCDRGSLTRRLQQGCAGTFRVEVVEQVRRRPRHDEARLLGLHRGERALIRRVRLCCDDRTVVYARSVIPPRSLQGRWRRLARLGSRSLGSALFADRSLRRGALELAAILPGQTLHDEACAEGGGGNGPIWGRRSLFWLHGRPLLVCEIFLDEAAR